MTTGLFGTNVSFVPTAEANEHDGHVPVPYTKDQVKDAPNAEADGALSQDEEAQLYSHYGLQYGEDRSDSGLVEGTSGDAGDTSGPSTDQARTRSEGGPHRARADHRRQRGRRPRRLSSRSASRPRSA